MILSLLIALWRNRRLPKWYAVAAQGVLAQSWLPWLPEQTFQTHCWFLSALVPYWLLFDVLFRRCVMGISRVTTGCLWLIVLSLPPWATVFLPGSLPGQNANWYASHQHGQLSDAVDYAVVILKFQPVCYLHVFVFGMVLARTRLLIERDLAAASPCNKYPAAQFQRTSAITVQHVRSQARRAAPLFTRVAEVLFRFGASIGYAGLFVVFTVEDVRPPSYKISARLTVLMLLQGLVLVGLAPIAPRQSASASPIALTQRQQPASLGQLSSDSPRILNDWMDPIEWLLCRAPAACGDLSYAQYVLQFIAYNLWPRQYLSHAWELPLFMVWLLSVAYIASHMVIAPLRQAWLRATPRSLLVISIVCSSIGAGICIADDISRHHSGGEHDTCGNQIGSLAAQPPAYVRVAPEAIDVKLNWTIVAGEFAVERSIINPSLLWSGGMLHRAARAHAVSCVATSGVRYAGQTNVTEYTTTWHSDILYSEEVAADEAAWQTWDVAAWKLDGHGSVQLRKLHLHHGNASLPWGPLCESSPRWQPGNSTLWRKIVTGPEDPKLVNAFQTDSSTRLPPRVVFGSMPPAAASDAQACDPHPKYQMYQTTDPDHTAAMSLHGVQLQCGRPTADEKNWIYFVDQGSLRYVYAVSPHAVVSQAASGACDYGRRYVGQLSSSASRSLAELAALDGIRVHGSASAINWDGSSRLALFHTKDPRGAYVTAAYIMDSLPPYTVRNVSRPLPVAGGHTSFASSLAWAPGGNKIVIGYGQADAHSRALVVSRSVAVL